MKEQILEMYRNAVELAKSAYEEMEANRNAFTERYWNRKYGERQALYEILCTVFDAKDEATEVFTAIMG